MKRAYLSIIHVFLVAFVVRHFSHGHPSPQKSEALLACERRDSCAPPGSVVLLGDSIIEGLSTPFPSVNLGVGGDTTSGLLARMNDYHCLKSASVVLILIGLNDLAHDGIDTEDNFRNIIRRLDGKRVLIFAVLPVDESAISPALSRITNVRILKLNSFLLSLAIVNSATFVPPSADFGRGGDTLDKQYHCGDGVHLNGAGYRILADKISGVIPGAWNLYKD